MPPLGKVFWGDVDTHPLLGPFYGAIHHHLTLAALHHGKLQASVDEEMAVLVMRTFHEELELLGWQHREDSRKFMGRSIDRVLRRAWVRDQWEPKLFWNRGLCHSVLSSWWFDIPTHQSRKGLDAVIAFVSGVAETKAGEGWFLRYADVVEILAAGIGAESWILHRMREVPGLRRVAKDALHLIGDCSCHVKEYDWKCTRARLSLPHGREGRIRPFGGENAEGPRVDG